MIHIGTSGFSYKDWEGPFYPQGLPDGDKLAFYAQEFDTVEVNFSFYRVPTPGTLVRMARKTPPGFVFTIKAHQEMTHKREDNAQVFEDFRRALEPWLLEGRLGCVLAQFPSSFHNVPLNREYLRLFRRRLPDLPLVVEFRHREWVTEETFGLLRELGVGFCCVDQPRFRSLVPPIAVATADIAYVRFHGRNAQKWWRHNEAWERYDYTYSEEELRPWVPKIRHLDEQARETFVFANNHWQGQAIDTARKLKRLLGLDRPQRTAP
ncbi:MAG: DUF72 domain-containing protein [Anaerolineae bacterium]|nr:DUF72 domain-containing protein [Anaerolineae bacterium]